MQLKFDDERAIEMAKEAIVFAIENRINVSYDSGTKGIGFYFHKRGCVSDQYTYLDWPEREELFTKMMSEAKRLCS
jgi:hypothetical protein